MRNVVETKGDNGLNTLMGEFGEDEGCVGVVSRRLRSSAGSILVFAPLIPWFWSDNSSIGVACRSVRQDVAAWQVIH